MKLRRCFALIGLACLSAVSAMSPAMAQFKDSDGNIHFQSGIAANAPVEVRVGSGLERKVTANYCGLVLISPPSTAPMPASITVDGGAVDVSALPVQPIPSCTNNTLKEPRAANFKDASGRVAIVGKTRGIQSIVVYPGVPNTKTIRANGCGYARISNSTTTPAPTAFTYRGTAYTTASLPTQIPNRCITVDGAPAKFVYTP